MSKYADREVYGAFIHSMGRMEFGWRGEADNPGYDITLVGPDGETLERFVPVDIFAATAALLSTVTDAYFSGWCYKVIGTFWADVPSELRPIP